MFKDLKSFFAGRNKKEVQNFEQKTKKMSYSLPKEVQPKTSLIIIVNQKGGCGKTTTCINLSACLARKGFKVLIIDLDAQSHASLGLGIDTENLTSSAYDVMIKNLELDQAIVPTYIKNLDIVPAVPMLSGAQLEIADLLGREGILRTAIYKMLNTKIKNYDYIIMDCSPSLNLLTINGMVAARSVLVPIQAHYFSLEGMKELFATIKVVQERLNFQLEILGILPTLFDNRAKINRDILLQIKDYFKEKVFKTSIRRNIKLAEASLHRKSIFEYDPSSRGAKDYAALTEEVISLTQLQPNSTEFNIDAIEREVQKESKSADSILN
ncbi:MAG: ParA family protein [Candidatus Omnitrophota bacterium]